MGTGESGPSLASRHLSQLESTSYTWSKPVLFGLVVAVLAAVPRLWELRVESLAWDQVATVLSGEGRQLGPLGEEVEVVRRTELFHNLVYKNMVRHLVPLLTSQVGGLGKMVSNQSYVDKQLNCSFDSSLNVTPGCHPLAPPRALPPQQGRGQGDRLHQTHS